MDPYQSSQTASDPTLPDRGRPCRSCGGTNTGTNNSLRPKPGILAIILFGWVAILIRTAFSGKTEACRDCGSTHTYRTAANQIAAVILIFLVSLIVTAWLIN